MKVVSEEYPLLTRELQSVIGMHENPLRWSSANKDHPGAIALSIVFAISSTLITRDLDPTLSGISIRCINDVQKIPQNLRPQETQVATIRWTCTALCALALCEAINPSSGQLWDLLGRACSTIEDLREEYQLQNMELDDAFIRLEGSLLKLESCTMTYFRLQSPYCALRLNSTVGISTSSGMLSDDLNVLTHQQNIIEHITHFPLQSEDFFESLIPLHLQVRLTTSDISIYSATLYLALHPIFTTSDIVACSASAIIDHFARLNEDKKIISISMAASQVLEAGLVWATYLMCRHQTAQAGSFYAMEPRLALGPILKVSALISSFVARWESGAVYAEAWETFVQLLWNMV
ncbi:uncharacterized protein A1O9_05648 [Exophiala aquamarina CBS 119918]|uniref:Transcription factor domain-containing protein n=1 Tax=Exophiala aquamarina CBS 119918 TaxID=1182545 RepID=A0A072PCB6_9EURO|nr:uncharacterized protein A1O9_05648 [Exophiala aquamarina CBS 119918]KEF57729.1 hypothetical protein A1O9_05648 [Exophiala aquamarina CBS 119918]